MNANSKIANFIIGGTEKAGTTSIFVYLSQHPDVCASSKKETDFFRHEYIGDKSDDYKNYARYFDAGNEAKRVLMEASPGYLGESLTVAPRMFSLTPDAKLLFILRDPVDRIYSSYNFHVGRLNIPKTIDFSEYVRRCMAYDSGDYSANDLALDDWYLKVLQFGRYSDSLKPFYDCFPAGNIKIMFFEDLKHDSLAFMTELSRFLEIDTTYWLTYEFRKTNVTFSSRNKLLHRLAMHLNSLSEPILRRRPNLKQALVNIYKSANQAQEGYDPMPNGLRNQLITYYQPSIDALRTFLKNDMPESWPSSTDSSTTMA